MKTPIATEPLDPTLDAVLTHALEQAPAPAIPADFAVRVCAALPPARAPRRVSHVSRTVAIAAVLALTIALFVLAPRATPSLGSVNFYIELLVLAQLGGLGYWLTARRGV